MRLPTSQMNALLLVDPERMYSPSGLKRARTVRTVGRQSHASERELHSMVYMERGAAYAVQQGRMAERTVIGVALVAGVALGGPRVRRICHVVHIHPADSGTKACQLSILRPTLPTSCAC